MGDCGIVAGVCDSFFILCISIVFIYSLGCSGGVFEGDNGVVAGVWDCYFGYYGVVFQIWHSRSA